MGVSLTAGINSKHGNAKQRKIQRLANTKVHISKKARIVASPVSGNLSATSKGTPADNEWPLARENFQQALVRRIKDLVPEEVVDVVLLPTVHMRGIGSHGVDAQSTVDVV